MHNYTWLCIIIDKYEWLCMIMHNYDTHAWFGPIFSILRFCHERGQIKRWGAVRHVIVSGISMRVFFFICIFSQKKNGFQASRCVMLRWRFLVFFREKNGLTQKCPRSVWEVSGTIPDLFWTISDPFWTKIA